ncbi:MAG TPA: MBL fold metallo-hydrolase [Thermoleophilaceae bacterium]|nr:MBL fold metallo-hydrolase [Thermoleophilaceae bacterium]
MRAVSVHRDALVLTSLMWQTNAVALRAGGEAMLIDSPYYPEELEALPSILAGAGFEPDALLATHGDFDHLLGRLAFPGLALGLGQPTVERFHREPGFAQRQLRDYDARLYVERPGPLSLGQVQTLPVPGSVELGDEELELHPASGHTSDGMAVFARWCGVLCVGDYLSQVEIPWISEGGSLDDYRATLARLAPLATAADTVVPGHGPPHGVDKASRLLEEDLEYLDALERREERPRLPEGRDTSFQRRIHAENLTRV